MKNVNQPDRIYLDGAFWGPWIRKHFISEIEWMSRSVSDHILPSFPDASIELDKSNDEIFEELVLYLENENNDIADFHSKGFQLGLEKYNGLTRIRQAALNFSAIMLWHLIEQQLMVFYSRQVLPMDQEHVLKDLEKREKKVNLNSLLKELDRGGCHVRKLPSWPKINELRLVANTVKHGAGRSLMELTRIRPDLLEPQMSVNSDSDFMNKAYMVEKPAFGEDIYVHDLDILDYFQAALTFWGEFSHLIESF